MKTTMASVSVVNDITRPIDTSNWTAFDKRKDRMTKEQKEAVKEIGKIVGSTTAPEDMDVDSAIQESMPWHEVKGKQDTKTSASQNETTSDRGSQQPEKPGANARLRKRGYVKGGNQRRWRKRNKRIPKID
jgi:hypothetical protein